MRKSIRRGAVWIAEREPLVVLLLAPWLLFPDASRPAAIAALAMLPSLWMLRLMAGRPLCSQTPLNGPLLLMLLSLGPAVLVSPQLDLTLPKATTFLLGMGLFLSLVNCDPRRCRPESGAMVLTAAGAVAACLALVGTDWVQGKMAFLQAVTDRLPRVLPVAPGSARVGFEPGAVAGTMALLLPVAVSYALLAWHRGRHPLMGHHRARAVVAAGGALVMAFVLVLTQSRSTVLVILLAGGAVISARRRSVSVVMTALALAAGVLLIIGLSTGHLSEWMQSVDAIGQPAGSRPTGWLSRLDIWRVAVSAVRDYPVVGVGLHAFGPVAWINYGFEIIDPGAPMSHAHNLVLQAGVDHGLIGVAAFGWLVVVLLVLGWAAQRGRSREERTLLLGIWLGLVAWMGHGLVNALPLGAPPALAVWGMMGLLTAAWTGGAAAPANGQGRRRWLGLVFGVSVVVLVAGLLLTPVWLLNRAANLLDRAILTGESGKLPEVLDLLGRAAELPGALRRRALTHYESDHWAQAAVLFRQDEDAEGYLVSQARLRLGQGRLAQARQLVLLGLQVVPDSGRLTCLGGDAHWLDGNLFEALRFYRMTPQRAESFAGDDAGLARCIYQLGALEKRLRRWEQAAESFGAAAALDPDEILYRMEHGWALFQATGELSEAAAIAEAALRLKPDAVEVMNLLADMYLQAGRAQRALEWSETAVATAPSDAEAWLRQALANWELGQFGEAGAALDEVLRLDPENPRALELQAEWSDQ